MSSVMLGPTNDWTPQEFNERAESYARSVVWLWLLGGCTYASISGGFACVPIIALFFPGIYLASVGVAAIQFYVAIRVLRFIRRLIDSLEAKDRLRGWPGHALIAGALVSGLVRRAVPISLAVLYVRLVRSIFYHP